MRPALLILPMTAWMWLAMMLVHELGHVVAAWLTGGTVVSVSVYPGQLSSTLVQPNPCPSIVLWAGFLTGWLVPLAIVVCRDSFCGTKSIRSANRDKPWPIHAVDCWAAFCLLAGGIYLAIGGTERLTDTGQLVEAGWPLPPLITIGASVAVVGYAWSRHAWPRLIADIRRRSPTTTQVAACWLLLAAWILGQWLLASSLVGIRNGGGG